MLCSCRARMARMLATTCSRVSRQKAKVAAEGAPALYHFWQLNIVQKPARLSCMEPATDAVAPHARGQGSPTLALTLQHRPPFFDVNNCPAWSSDHSNFEASGHARCLAHPTCRLPPFSYGKGSGLCDGALPCEGSASLTQCAKACMVIRCGVPGSGLVMNLPIKMATIGASPLVTQKVSFWLLIKAVQTDALTQCYP